MRLSRFFFLTSLTLSVAAALLPVTAPGQSGRGRPRVPGRQPPAVEPPTVKVPEVTAIASKEQTGTTARFVLRNGITVVINEQHALPLAAVVALFRIRDRNDSDGNHGIARLTERVIVSGSSNSADGLADSETFPDQTLFSYVVSSGRTKDALTAQARMLLNPKIDDSIVKREAALLISDLSLGLADPAPFSHASPNSLHTQSQPLARAYSSGVYSRGLRRLSAAQEQAVRGYTAEQIRKFYLAHYRPDNLVITVVGDVSTFHTLVEIQELYASFKAPATPPADEVKTANGKTDTPKTVPGVRQDAEATGDRDPGGDAERTQTVPEAPIALQEYENERADIVQSIVTARFRVSDAGDSGWPSVEVLAAVLGEGRGSRLWRTLVEEQQVASMVHTNLEGHRGRGYLVVQIAISRDSSIDKVEAAFFREIARLQGEPPSDSELTRAKTWLYSRFIDRSGTYAGRAMLLAQMEALSGDALAVYDYKDRIDSVAGSSVHAAARRLLAISNTYLYEYEPLTAPARTFDRGGFAATVISWAPDIVRDAGAEPKSQAGGRSEQPDEKRRRQSADQQAVLESLEALPVRDYSTLNGPRVYVREDHSRPVVTVAMLFQGGRLLEDETNSGITELMVGSLLRGTPRMTNTQVVQALEDMGAELTPLVEPDFFGVLLTVMSKNAEPAIKLVRDLIESPAFRGEDIKRASILQIGRIRQASDSGLERSRALLLQAVFPGHPYSFHPHGREELVSKLSGEQIQQWYEATIKRQVPLAVIVGDTSGSALVSADLAEGFRRREVDSSLKVRVPGSSKPAERIESRSRPVTALSLGFAAPKGESFGDQVVLQLIESTMNGRHGRLAERLRRRDGIASASFITTSPLFGAGALYVSALAAPDAERQTRMSIMSELQRLSLETLRPPELESVRLKATVLTLLQLQSPTTRAIEYARAVFYQRQAADVDSLVDRLKKTTADDIKRVASTYLKVSDASAGIVRGTSSRPTQN